MLRLRLRQDFGECNPCRLCDWDTGEEDRTTQNRACIFSWQVLHSDVFGIAGNGEQRSSASEVIVNHADGSLLIWPLGRTLATVIGAVALLRPACNLVDCAIFFFSRAHFHSNGGRMIPSSL